MNKYTVLAMLESSAISYKKIQPAKENVKLYIIDDRQTDLQGYIRIAENKMLITFRGTDSDRDWITDFTFWKKRIPYDNQESKIRVHTGFINAYKREDVRGKILSILNSTYIDKVFITGHSYGAALATLCAVDIEYNFPHKDIEVILFGCPRVGNKYFSKSYNKRVFKTLRVENGNDIVTKVPFAFLGYRHVGIRIHIGKKRLPLVISAEQHRPQKYFEEYWKTI